MDLAYCGELDTLYSKGGDEKITCSLDSTPYMFDNTYYNDLVASRGFLNSDQSLFSDSVKTRSIVIRHSDIMATPRIILSALICLFVTLNLSVTNLVALTDPHSVGNAHSFSIVYHLYNMLTSGCPATTWMWPTVVHSMHSALRTAIRRPLMA
ncbi:hypothetical protein PR202_gb22339 [Eleusine coracana subsp. coracana]|uniref:Plant heme peroxidase family profile domain-containing protein n=1 Tax=Eleusine coracana subsp. coracana TaxID=191504 RepID=A0AAV5FG17_ELECO|nr:hypothetical protein PR202_gb22339 [Eleusine coracana subsp. coracana]